MQPGRVKVAFLQRGEARSGRDGCRPAGPARRRDRLRRAGRRRRGRRARRRRAPRRRRLRRLRAPPCRAPRRCCPACRSSRPTRPPSGPTSCCSPSPTTCCPAWSAASPPPAASAPARSSCTPPGAHGVAVLDPATAHGVLPLALHPVMTFTGRPEDVARLAGASVGVTAAAGEEAAWSVGEALVVEMGAEPVRVPESVRPLYHAALAHGANHLITLVRDCVDVLERAGVHPAERLVAPLLSAALDNALRHGDRALTGPGRPRRRRHGPHPPARARRRRPRPGRDLPGPGRPHRPPRPARRPAARPRRRRGARDPRRAEGALT